MIVDDFFGDEEYEPFDVYDDIELTPEGHKLTLGMFELYADELEYEPYNQGIVDSWGANHRLSRSWSFPVEEVD
jgi:hypothetical protein